MRLRSQRMVALAVLAAVTNGGTLGAQGPVKVGATGANAPTLLSDCDITVQSCGTPGGELGGGGGYGNGVGGSGGFWDPSSICGQGVKLVCDYLKKETCLEYVVTDASGKIVGGATAGGIGYTVTTVCARYVTNELWFYNYR